MTSENPDENQVARAPSDQPEESARREFIAKAVSVFAGGAIVSVPVGVGVATLLGPAFKEGQGGIKIRLAALASEAKVYGYSLPKGGQDLIDSGFDLMFEDFECADCHGIQGEDEGSGPSLTGYMSPDWMIDFIADPTHEKFYGKKNDRMPSFLGVKQEDGTMKAGELSRKEVELIVGWLREEWPRASE